MLSVPSLPDCGVTRVRSQVLIFANHQRKLKACWAGDRGWFVFQGACLQTAAYIVTSKGLKPTGHTKLVKINECSHSRAMCHCHEKYGFEAQKEGGS